MLIQPTLFPTSPFGPPRTLPDPVASPPPSEPFSLQTVDDYQSAGPPLAIAPPGEQASATTDELPPPLVVPGPSLSPGEPIEFVPPPAGEADEEPSGDDPAPQAPQEPTPVPAESATSPAPPVPLPSVPPEILRAVTLEDFLAPSEQIPAAESQPVAAPPGRSGLPELIRQHGVERRQILQDFFDQLLFLRR